VNKGFYTGNVGREPEARKVATANGEMTVLNFPLAVKKRQKGSDGKPLTLWIDCAIWGKRAESLQRYIQKGDKLAVSGETDVRGYTNSNGQAVGVMVLTIDDIDLDPRGADRAQQGGQQGYQQGGQQGGQQQAPAGQAQQQRPATTAPSVPAQGAAVPGQPAGQPTGPAVGAPAPGSFDDFDDEIPF
jgi:single-strand DNA-binding protein